MFLAHLRIYFDYSLANNDRAFLTTFFNKFTSFFLLISSSFTMELIPFEYIYQPQVSSIYEYVMNVVSIFSCATFLFVAYTVLKKSPKIFQFYKWLIFSTLNWCFMYDVVICVCQPVILPPFWMGIFQLFLPVNHRSCLET